MKKITLLSISTVILAMTMGITNAFDVSQEIGQNGGTVKIDEKITLDLEAQTFASSVNFASKSINDIDGKYDASKFEDKGFGAFSLDFSNKSGGKVENSKAIKLAVIGLDNYKAPVLLKSSSGTVEEIAWIDDLWSFVFTIDKSPSGNYKIVEKKISTSTTSLGASGSDISADITSSNMEATSTGEIQAQTSLENKDIKGVNSLILLLLLSAGILTTFGAKYLYNKI